MDEWIRFKSWELNIEGQPEETTIFSHTFTQTDMPQTMNNKANETKSENRCPSIPGDEVHAMTLVHNDRVQSLLKISLAVTLIKVRDVNGSDTVDKSVNILHCEEFCVNVFEAMEKCRSEYQLITEDVVKKNRTG